MKTKKNNELFFEIYRYAARITKLAEMVDQDSIITQEQYQVWAKNGIDSINDIKDWMKKVYLHINRG